MVDEIVVRIGEAEVTLPLKARTFSTQSTGFNGNGKLTDGDKKYQISCNCVLIGSKPGSKPATKRK